MQVPPPEDDVKWVLERIDPHDRGETPHNDFAVLAAELSCQPGSCVHRLVSAIVHATGWIEPEELRALVALWYYRLALPDAARGELADAAVSAMSLNVLAAKSASAASTPTRCVVSRVFCFTE